jgi:hypothetical protein
MNEIEVLPHNVSGISINTINKGNDSYLGDSMINTKMNDKDSSIISLKKNCTLKNAILLFFNLG